MAGSSVVETASSHASAVDVLTGDLERARRNVAALGEAIVAAGLTVSPALARATVAQHDLYASIEVEFGLLTSTEVADRLGSRATARRNAAAAAHRAGRLLAIRRGRYLRFPGFQFDETGPRPVVEQLRSLADGHGWDEASLTQWLVSPTTYLNGSRPVDVIDEPERLLDTARRAFATSW